MAGLSNERVGIRLFAAIVLSAGVALTPLPAWATTAPSAPRLLTGVAALPDQVTLSWLAPTSSGTSPIADYGYDVSTDGGTTFSGTTTWFGSTALAASVACTNSGAANVNGKGCRYRVRAHSAAGDSAFSNTI